MVDGFTHASAVVEAATVHAGVSRLAVELPPLMWMYESRMTIICMRTNTVLVVSNTTFQTSTECTTRG